MVSTSIAARVAARRAVGRLLGAMPLEWTDRIRKAGQDAQPGTLPHRALTTAMGLLRHRPLEDLEVFSPADDPDLQLLASDSLLARRLYWFGEHGYEGVEADWWRRCCRDATNILELGANIGYYTVIGARANPSARYVAVEPHPYAASTLRRNLALNGVEHVEVLEVAVVGEPTTETVELVMPDLDAYAAPTGSYLRDLAEDMGGREASQGVTVTAMAMRDLIAGVDLMKLDIEGMEAKVLGAVHEELLSQRPVILLEVLQQATRLRALVADLHRAGYVVFVVGQHALHLVPGDVVRGSRPLPSHGSRDVLLVPQERVGQL